MRVFWALTLGIVTAVLVMSVPPTVRPQAPDPRASGGNGGNRGREATSNAPKQSGKGAGKKQEPGDAFRTMMNHHVSMALDYMIAAVPPKDRAYTRFLSLYDVDDLDELRTLWKLGNWWNQQMSFDEYFHLVRPVPGSGARLFALDLRDFRWNGAAWQAVAGREPRFRQPWIHFKKAEQLRREAGYVGIKPNDEGTTPVLVVMSWLWFLRETLETQRSPSYYDLLYAENRFIDQGLCREVKFVYARKEEWPGGVDPRDDKYYKRGAYTVWKTAYRQVPDYRSFKFRDFPKNQDELEGRLGVDRARAFAQTSKTDIDNGAIVAGGKDDPQNGSFVALQNRLIVMLDGPLGPYMLTNDVEKTSGLRDYSNSLIFAGKGFRRGRGARAVRDAGEILFYLRNGAQGGLLVNGQGKRVELAAQTIAQETTEKTMNIGVRTYGSCATCHAGGGGYIPPRDLYAKWKAMGIKFKFYNPGQAARVEGFFHDLDDRLLTARKRYEKLINETTQPLPGEAKDAKPWAGADVAAAVRELRKTYDGPVNADLAAREFGIPKPALLWLLQRVGVEAPKKGVVNRYNTPAQVLIREGSIPRSSWDEDVFLQVGLMADAQAGDPDFKKLFDTAQVPPLVNP
jgi:hypothetical protein